VAFVLVSYVTSSQVAPFLHSSQFQLEEELCNLFRCRSHSLAGSRVAAQAAAYRYLALHFVAVEMLLGGLLLAVLLSLYRGSPESLVAARALARRLTVVMTFVINLGVPPLLFAQVLYGRALYTSSVLIGLYWISIIAILTFTYWLLYQFTARLDAGKSAWWVGLSAWLLAGFIARLLSSNMTLMLRPECGGRCIQLPEPGRTCPPATPP